MSQAKLFIKKSSTDRQTIENSERVKLSELSTV